LAGQLSLLRGKEMPRGSSIHLLELTHLFRVTIPKRRAGMRKAFLDIHWAPGLEIRCKQTNGCSPPSSSSSIFVADELR
jgi:hypothetical protein